MAKLKRLYIDADGVKRGYYVYLHRERTSGTVFYVGKGHGNRAWEKKRRHKHWLEKVALLGDDWEVIVVSDDLTEIEAFGLEEDMTSQYGGAACDGGTLVNRVPGGENPMSVSITVSFGEGLSSWQQEYDRVRKFKAIGRNDQERFARSLTNDLESVTSALEDLQEENDCKGKVSDSILDLDCIVGSQIDMARDFIKRRVTWHEFALGLEDAIEDLQPSDINEMHRAIRPLAKNAAGILNALLNEIDSGNRADAEAAANLEIGKKRGEKRCQEDSVENQLNPES